MSIINPVTSYAYTTLNTKINKNFYTKPQLKTKQDYLKNGYCLIKKNPNTKAIEITYPYNYESKQKELFQKKYNITIKKMINNWNNYRDEQNYLLGDISPYFNYKETIERMVIEDNYILEELYKRKYNIHSDNDSDYNSDDEHNNYLIY